MKKSGYLALFAIAFLATYCGGAKAIDNISQGEGSVDEMEGGFVGEDKLIVKGVGVSKEGVKTQLQKEGTAKEAARMDAMSKVIEVCRGANIQAAATVENNQLAGSAIGKDLAGRIKGAKVKKSNCKPDGELMGCKVIMEIEKKGIKNYVGGNALIEMGQAYVNNKKIFLLNDIPQDLSYTAEIECMDPICLKGDLRTLLTKR